MNAEQLITGRRSVRKYKDQKVDRKTMQEIIELSKWAPSWANSQIARYTLVEDPAVIEKFAGAAVQNFAYNINTLKNAKGVAVLSFVKGKSGKLDGKGDGEDMSHYWEAFDAGIACQTFCLAAYAKGVGTCIFGVIDNKTIAEIVNLPAEETVGALITYGYEEGGHPDPTPRMSAEEISRYIG